MSETGPLISHERQPLVAKFDIFDDAVDIIEFEETQPLSEPLSAPQKAPTGLNTQIPSTRFALELQKQLQGYPQRVRNIAIAGHSSHGKTSLVQSLCRQTHFDRAASMTDVSAHENKRSQTLEVRPINIVTSGTGQSISLTLVDTPGHADFWDELDAGLDLADAVIVVLDAAEPIMPTARRALAGKKPAVVCINKIDRLLLELKLSPLQAAQRLEYLQRQLPPCPVVFASSKYNFSFTRKSISQLYAKYAGEVDLSSPGAMAAYGLEPIQKLFNVGLCGEQNIYEQVCQELGVEARRRLAATEKLATLFDAYFETPLGALVDSFNVPSNPSHQAAKQVLIGGKLFSFVRATTEPQLNQPIYIPCGDYFIPVDKAHPGNIYLIEGGAQNSLLPGLYAPLNVGVEPVSAKDRPKLESALGLLEAAHHSLIVNVQGTGEIIISGPGELYLDHVLAQVREFVQVKLTQPSVHFQETLLEPSFRACSVSTFDGACSVKISASNSDQVEFEGMPAMDVSGALCEEPVRKVKFVCEPPLLKADILQRSMLARGCKGAMLLGKPALLEPVFRVTAISSRGGAQLYNILRERRGKVLTDEQVPGTSLFLLTGQIPCLDSLGFETQALGHLHGHMRVVLEFDGWQLVPGDGLEQVTVPKMKMADNLARDIVVKLRKRKGLSYEPSLKQLVGEDAMASMGFEDESER